MIIVCFFHSQIYIGLKGILLSWFLSAHTIIVHNLNFDLHFNLTLNQLIKADS